MAIDAGMAAAALAETWQHLTRAIPGSWVARDGGAIACVTGVGWPTANGVWPERADPEPGAVGRLLDRVAATGLPHCFQLRPGASPALARLPTARGMSLNGKLPLMVLDDPAVVTRARPPTGLVLRELSPDQAEQHASVAAAGFETPKEPFVQLITAEVLHLPGVRCYLGEVDGQPVTTGVGITLGAFVGVFNIATPPPHRGRGYGASVTARAAADGLAAGAHWSWLQSSPAGYASYTRLGFRTLESWQCWVAAA